MPLLLPKRHALLFLVSVLFHFGAVAQTTSPDASASGALVASPTLASEPSSATAVAPVMASVEAPPRPAPQAAPSRPQRVPFAQINAGDTAWMIVASVLVLLMSIPGLALFYAGMVRKKNILATMAQTFAVCALVTVLWFAAGYSLAFMPGSDWIGGTQAMFLDSLFFNKDAGQLSVHHLAPTVPESVFVMFQLTFAIITPALITGAFAERMRFSALLLFMTLWSLLVYAPVAHWVWEPGGWLARRGVLDFAGGTVVHVNAGIAGLACAWMLGRREGFGQEALMPSNLGYTMIGASLLWVGWMGFNGGSACAADGRAGMAMLVTQLAAAGAALSWMAAEWALRGTPTLLGMCSGAVAGLVAITPASGFVDAKSALLIGAIAGVGCYWGATGLKRLLGADDSLDVFGVHGVGGAIGALLTGALASPAIGGVQGSVVNQAVGVGATLLYSGVATLGILWLVDGLVGLRVTPRQEADGLDLSLHGERVE
ncbi:ammonium transporter [Aquabacterium sp.]|uniref:ammonium transporter n=1 Tax=Aquabacterium sp. TaxID=1872578 RepID=UPI003D6C7C77